MNKSSMIDTVFFIANSEMAKPKKEMRIPLILACADAAGELDPRYKADSQVRAEFADSIERSTQNRAINSPKRHSKKVIAILVAAAVILVAAGCAVLVITDPWALLKEKYGPIYEWENGELHRIGDKDFITWTDVTEYRSFEELVVSEKLDIAFPHLDGGRFRLDTLSVSSHEPVEHEKLVLANYYSDQSKKLSLSITINTDGKEEFNEYIEFGDSDYFVGEYSSADGLVFHFVAEKALTSEEGMLLCVANSKNKYYAIMYSDINDAYEIIDSLSNEIQDTPVETDNTTEPERVDPYMLLPEYENIPGTVVGAWTADFMDHTTICVLNSDGTGKVIADTGNVFDLTYTVLDDRRIEESMVNIYGEQVTDVYEYELSGDTLIFDGIEYSRIES